MFRYFILIIILCSGVIFFMPTDVLCVVKNSSPTPKDLQKLAEKRRKELNERHETMLKVLKKKNPAKYEEYKAQWDRQKKMEKVVGDFKRNKISLSDARKALLPLMEAHLKNESDDHDQRIAELTVRINELQGQIKKNPKAAHLSKELSQTQEQLKNLQETKSSPAPQVESEIDKILGVNAPSVKSR